jgi:predicted DNA-binding protein with PD1-like motif
MKLKRFSTCMVIRIERNEEIITAVQNAIQKAGIKGGFFYGLGVGKELELGYFDAHKRSYIRKRFDDEYEFTSFVGNVSMLGDEIVIHCHVTITDANFNAFGGHLFKGVVPATLEVVLFPFAEPLTRKKDDATGLNLLEL